MATTIGLLHPGDMGAVVGGCARAAGQRVLWAAAGRSADTRARAAAAGLEDAGSVAKVLAASDVVLSICPPHAALDLAREVAAQRFTGLYVDGNAIAPATAREIGVIVERGGATFVDGGLIGPPPRAAGSTRLYLSGREAKRAVALFEGSALEAIAINDVPGAASALKMVYAAFTKGTSALLMGVRALAASEGVDDALARRVAPLAARPAEEVGGRRAGQRAQGLALRGRDGRDRGDLRGRRSPGRLSPGVWGDLSPARRVQGRDDSTRDGRPGRAADAPAPEEVAGSAGRRCSSGTSYYP